MGIELNCQSLLELLDSRMHRGKDADQAHDGLAQGGLHWRRLPKRGLLQISQDLLNQRRVVAAAATVQQCHYLSRGQSRAELGGVRRRQDYKRSFVLEVWERVQRLRIELQQYRAESACRLCSAQIAS